MAVKAVILGVGRPWCLGPQPMELAPVVNRPLLLRQLDALHEAGIRDIAFVGDETGAAAVQAALAAAGEPALDLCLILTRPEAGPAERLLAAEPFLSTTGCFVVQPGHTLVEHDVRRSVGRVTAQGVHAVVVNRSGPRTTSSAAGLRALNAWGAGDPRLSPALLVCDAEILSVIHSAGSEIDLEQAVLALSERSGRIETQAVSGWSESIESVEDLLRANHRLLDQLDPGPKPRSLPGSNILGPVAIGRAAQIECSLVRGPVAIDARARISDAYIGPYTCIGEAAVIDRVEMQSCVILPGASLENLPARLEGSVIGENARVSRQLGPPRTLRLSVGAESRLSLT